MARPPLKAQELADTLAAAIRAGEVLPGSWLPPERELAEAHGVSRGTARQAAQLLTETGLVEFVPGSGTRVRPAVSRRASDEPVDVRAELAAVRRLLLESEARLAAIEKHLG